MNELSSLLNLDASGYLAGPEFYLILAGTGLVIGILTGLFGVGGGFLVTPLLNAAFGIPYNLAVGSGVCFILGTSTAGTLKHHHVGNVEFRTIALLGVGSVLGAIAGDMLQDILVVWVAGGDQARYETIMTVLFIALLLVTAWLIFRGPSKKEAGLSPVQRFPIGPYVDLPAIGRPNVSVTAMAGIGFGVGILTGIFGVGGGVLLVPILVLAVGLTPHQAAGTSLGVVFLAALAATVKKGFAGKVSLSIALALMAGSVVGVQIGVFLGAKLHATKLRRYFAIVVLAAVALLTWKVIAG